VILSILRTEANPYRNISIALYNSAVLYCIQYYLNMLIALYNSVVLYCVEYYRNILIALHNTAVWSHNSADVLYCIILHLYFTCRAFVMINGANVHRTMLSQNRKMESDAYRVIPAHWNHVLTQPACLLSTHWWSQHPACQRCFYDLLRNCRWHPSQRVITSPVETLTL